MVLPILFWLMNSVCPTLYFNLDFKATIETQHINKAKLPYKSSNDYANLKNGGISQFESRKSAW